jgi:hypothetical protein
LQNFKENPKVQETSTKVKTTLTSAKDSVSSGVSSLYWKYWKKEEELKNGDEPKVIQFEETKEKE